MELGKLQELKIVRFREFGAFLADPESGDGAETVLLPKKQVPEGAKTGDTVHVFLYKDSADRPIATVKEPFVTVGKIAKLRIRDVTKSAPSWISDWSGTSCFPSGSGRGRSTPGTPFWRRSMWTTAAVWRQPCGSIRT